MTTHEQIKDLLEKNFPYVAAEDMSEIEEAAKEIYELTKTLHPVIEKMLFAGLVTK